MGSRKQLFELRRGLNRVGCREAVFAKHDHGRHVLCRERRSQPQTEGIVRMLL